MNIKKTGLFFATLGGSLLFLGALVQPAAALCSPAQTAANLVDDDYYMCGGPGYSGWQCDDGIRSYFWNEFGFGEDDSWVNRGYSDPCNNSLKLAQTFNALAVLGYAHTYTPNCDLWVEHVATGGLCYAATQINQLRARVGDGSENASTSGRKVTVYNPFFTQDVAQRAGTIYHEARHADGCGHNASDSSCDRHASCDKSWENGCPAAGDDMGANRYHVTFLRAYGVSPHAPPNPTPPNIFSIRRLAILRANDLLENAFRDDPCFRFNEFTGAAYDSCL